MSRLNDEFMESFKHLDKICRDMFGGEKGVTSYIETMESISGGELYVSSWNNSLYKLKKYRHIRNEHSHEVGTSYSDICSQEDVEWLIDFYNSIMNTTAPYAQYKKLIAQKSRANVSNSKQLNSPTNNNYVPIQKDNSHKVRVIVAVSFVIILIVAVIIFILVAFSILK